MSSISIECPKTPIALLIACSLLWLAGCAGPRTAADQREKGRQSIRYKRSVNPFPVFEGGNEPIAHPFLGGFNTPRPQFIDIDADGDSDLFVQENANELMFFENKSARNTTAASLKWQTNRYRDLAIGEWFRFADMDQDGDFDLLTEQPYSYIRYYRNDGTPRKPEFTMVSDTLKTAGGTSIFSDRQNIPNVTDIDCDGRLDLFIGRLDGTIMRYESTGLDDREVPQFELVNKQFEGIKIVKKIGTLHGANTLTFADIDHDGNQDLFWGDFFEPGLLLIENTGSCGNPVLQSDPEPFPPSNPIKTSGYNAPAFTDWGGDGDLDLFVGVLGGAYGSNKSLSRNFYYYEQAKSGKFRRRSRQFLNSIDIGNESKPAVGDIDGDGDADLLLGNKIDPENGKTSLVYRFENRGKEGNTSLHRTGSLDLPNAYHYAPALGDLNGDGRADLLLGSWRGNVAYYKSRKQGFEKVSDSYIQLESTSHSAPVLGDLDGDGDLDLVVGESGGGLFYFENQGTSRKPEFVRRKKAFSNVQVDRRSTPALHDIDSDGDLDLFIGSKSGGVAFYRNTGNRKNPHFKKQSLPFKVPAPGHSVPRFGDLNGDGQAELLFGAAGGGLLYYHSPTP